jgi:hypothetical protein
VPPGDVEEEPGVSVIARSADKTVTLLVAVLFAAVGSKVVEAADALPEITVPAATPAFTVTSSVNEAVPALANAEPSVHVMVPVAPAAGAVHVQPAGGVTEANVVFVGVTCVQAGAAAADAPLLVTTTV